MLDLSAGREAARLGRCQSHSQAGPHRPAPARQPCSSRGARQQPCSVGRRARRAGLVATAALRTGEVGKFISKTPIPAFIPRNDLIEQLYRWALTNASDPYQAAQFGLPLKISPMYREEVMWGISAAVVKDGETATTIIARFDEEMCQRHSYVGRGSDGFPSMAGDVQEVMGSNLEIWKLDENKIEEDVRETIRAYCSSLVAALNKYYAFGSPFVDDST